MTVAIALFTSPRWLTGYGFAEAAHHNNCPVADNDTAKAVRDNDRPATSVDDIMLRRFATAVTALIYTQILVGATMRHTGAGLAIPDFPWMFGHVVPDHWNAQIAIHFAHRVGALLVTLGTFTLAGYVWSHHRGRRELARPAALILALVATQVTLGALTVLTGRDVWINSFHVVCGALVLTTSLVLTLRSWRGHFADERQEPQSAQREETIPVSAIAASSAVERDGARA